MIAFFKTYRLSIRMRLVAGVTLLGLSCLLLVAHADAVRAMRETGLPAAVELPVLEQRMRILKEQNEVVELQAALSTGSAQEMVEVYALPSDTGTVRVLASFDVFFAQLQKSRALIDVSPVTVADSVDGPEGTTIVPLSFTAHLTRDGWKKMLLFFDLSGLITVGDAVDAEQFQALLALTEQENPATVAALEQFFNTDLLRYAEEPRSFNEALLKSFSSDASLQAVRAFLDSPTLQTTRDLLGPMGASLRESRLWPLQFLQVQTVSQRVREDGTLDVTLTVGAYVRTNEGRQ
jgi:hypothetical protein